MHQNPVDEVQTMTVAHLVNLVVMKAAELCTGGRRKGRRGRLVDYGIRPLHVQRALYALDCEHLRITGRPLVPEQWIPAPYGPMLLSVHDYYVGDGEFVKAGMVDARAARSKRGASSLRLPALDQVAMGAEVQRFVADFLLRTKDMVPKDLMEAFRLEGDAWAEAWCANERFIDPKAMARSSRHLEELKLVPMAGPGAQEAS